ncbi:hypothetical protein [Novosphingobium terrae]|uniref:hypothetical protein n=1 Tax=Novosphingobium terrae TaxID=2726189 RepID=UPI0019815D81|nr:hypothetical protein [Novosphingobium terrae]
MSAVVSTGRRDETLALERFLVTEAGQLMSQSFEQGRLQLLRMILPASTGQSSSAIAAESLSSATRSRPVTLLLPVGKGLDIYLPLDA